MVLGSVQDVLNTHQDALVLAGLLFCTVPHNSVQCGYFRAIQAHYCATPLNFTQFRVILHIGILIGNTMIEPNNIFMES